MNSRTSSTSAANAGVPPAAFASVSGPSITSKYPSPSAGSSGGVALAVAPERSCLSRQAAVRIRAFMSKAPRLPETLRPKVENT